MSPTAVVCRACIIRESRVPREDALKAAIAAHEDVDVLQKLCEGRKVPEELRMDLWKVGLSLTGHVYIVQSISGVSGGVSTS